MPRSNRSAELERLQNHEKHSRHNVNQGENGVTREEIIGRSQFRQSRVGGRSGWPIAVHEDRNELRNPARGNRRPDHGQKNNCGP